MDILILSIIHFAFLMTIPVSIVRTRYFILVAGISAFLIYGLGYRLVLDISR